jgi:hypothetical protein
VAAVLAALAVITVSHGKQQGWQEVQTARKNAARQLIVLVIQLLYPKISTRTFQMFRCRDLGQGIGNLLEADFGKECFEGVHAQYVPYAVISAVVYLVGVPVGTFYALWSNRHKLHTQIVQARYGELYRHYDPKWFFWEVLLMINKCMLTGAMCAIAPGTPLQLLVAVIVCASYLLLVLHASPYRGILEDRLAFGTSLSLSFSLLLGLTIVMDSPQKPAFNSEWMGVMLILVNVVPLILFLVFTLLVLKNGPNYGLMSAAEDVTQSHPQIVTDRVRVQPRLRHRLSAVDVQKVVVHDKVRRIENTSLSHRAAHVARIKEREAHADARVKARLAERAARKKSYVAKEKTENNNTSVVVPQSPAELIAGGTIGRPDELENIRLCARKVIKSHRRLVKAFNKLGVDHSTGLSKSEFLRFLLVVLKDKRPSRDMCDYIWDSVQGCQINISSLRKSPLVDVATVSKWLGFNAAK